jgi:predicted DNA-binding ribbon-helix-helix protein
MKMIKRSLTIKGHSTSVSLEAAFWEALHLQARQRTISIAALVAEIDATREDSNLSSAIRVWLLERAKI